jgi:hypothetical protein
MIYTALLIVTQSYVVENKKLEYYIHGSVHRNSVSTRSNKVQQYAGIYLLQNYSTCFGCSSHPSSGVHKTLTTASGTGHSNNLLPTWPI